MDELLFLDIGWSINLLDMDDGSDESVRLNRELKRAFLVPLLGLLEIDKGLSVVLKDWEPIHDELIGLAVSEAHVIHLLF